MPFAIECAGNEFVIGQKALETATKGLSQNAFANIFDTCKGIKTFQFSGRDEQLNKLPYYAIRYYISKILSDSFYGEKGTIDSNVSKLPLVFLFTPELDTNKRLFITNSFEQAGFQNLYSISYHQLLLPVAMDSLSQVRQKVKVAIMVSVDAGDLLLQAFDVEAGNALDETIRIEGKGSDPRLKQATDLIWSRLFGYNYKSREPEEEMLKAAAWDFLNGDSSSVNGSLLMSDGSKQDYFLNRSDLDVSAIGEVRNLVEYKLNNFLLSHGLQKQQCMVVLVGNAATDYFEKIFSPMAWAAVAKVQDKMKRAMLDRLYKMVADANYEVHNLFGPRVQHPPTSSTESGPTAEENKQYRVLVAEIKGKLRAHNVNDASRLIAKLDAWVKKKGFTQWNAGIEELKKCVCGQDVITITISDPPRSELKREPSVPPVDKKTLHRQVRIDLAEVMALARTGKGNEAEKRFRKIEADLHKKGVTDFDDELKKVKSTIGEKVTTTPPEQPEKEKTRAELLMQNGDFAEAKREFALQGNSAMAQACSKLIEAKRTIAKYTGKRSAVPKRKAVEELEGCASLYRLHGLATDEIEQLIRQYK